MGSANSTTIASNNGKANGIVKRTRTICATHAYVAPEMIEKRGYAAEADLRTLEVFLFDVTQGFTPWNTRSIETVKRNMAELLKNDVDLDNDALGHLVSALLKRRWDGRLGYGAGTDGNSGEMKRHDFFLRRLSGTIWKKDTAKGYTVRSRNAIKKRKKKK